MSKKMLKDGQRITHKVRKEKQSPGEGRKEGRKEGRTEGRKEERKEGRKEETETKEYNKNEGT